MDKETQTFLKNIDEALTYWGTAMNKKEEQAVIEALKDRDNGTQSMRVVGRGGLTMNASDARNSKKFKDLLSRASLLIGDIAWRI